MKRRAWVALVTLLAYSALTVMGGSVIICLHASDDLRGDRASSERTSHATACCPEIAVDQTCAEHASLACDDQVVDAPEAGVVKVAQSAVLLSNGPLPPFHKPSSWSRDSCNQTTIPPPSLSHLATVVLLV